MGWAFILFLWIQKSRTSRDWIPRPPEKGVMVYVLCDPMFYHVILYPILYQLTCIM